jgi:glycosyltransferase involved in cell wall biosynthesis
MRTSVHQFHQGIRRGDAIGEELLALRGILRRAGYDSEIFVGEPIPEDLAGEILRLEEYSDNADQLLLVHHSIGHHYAGLISRFADTKVLVYHNITPPRFFVGNPYMQKFLERGRRQLRTLRPYLAGAFADSGYNASELRRAGYLRIEILPPVFALGRLLIEPPGLEPPPPPENRFLFVGRFATSKRQDDVVEAFDAFASRYDRQALLTLVGAADPNDPYAQLVFRRIERSPFRDRIETPGVVSDRELARLFRQASVYLSMSEHEGFGVPLLESFHAGVPVIAFDSGAVAETMGGAGLLFSRKRMEEVSSLMAEVVFDPAFRERIVEGQRRRLQEPDIALAEDRFLAGVDGWFRMPGGRRSIAPGVSPLKIRIDGPFESSYGLAVANRRLAEALSSHTGHRISIHCTEGPGDYLPRATDLADKPLAKRLWENSFRTPRPDVVIRNTYPPRFDRLPVRLQLANFAWEDSRLPAGWAEGFNSSYDGILTPTTYVRDVLRSSGVTIPIEVVPNVVELDNESEPSSPASRPSEKTTRFLCVGSAFPRKGVDVLIRAFLRAFRREDDVALILKSFPSIHNTLAGILADVRRRDPDSPEIVQIDRDISSEDLLALYRSSDVLVHPSRAEGFGFPVAEAMLLGLPVIAPSSTGLADFCSPDTVLVIPHRWEPSGSHFAVPGAEWAEPNEDALVEMLRAYAFGALRAEGARRAKTARRLVSERFSARAVAKAAERAIEKLDRERSRPISVGFVSTWNSLCGIAAYTRDLTDSMSRDQAQISFLANADANRLGPEGPEVERVWVQAAGDYAKIVNEALERELEIVHIQFHPGILSEYRELSRTIHGLRDRGVRVFVTVHLAEEVNFYGQRMVLDDLREAFSRCEKLFVHSERDLVRLLALGLEGNLERISFGGMVSLRRDRETLLRDLGLEGKRLVASFGFALPHKGVLEAIEAMRPLRARYPNLFFLALAARRPEAASGEYLELCRARVRETGMEDSVLILDEFLPEKEIDALLSAAEVVVLPYLATKESASAAIRFPLACGRATITTREQVFDDIRPVVHQIPSADPVVIAEAIERLLSDDELRRSLEEAAWRFAAARTWPSVASAHLGSYRSSRSDVPVVTATSPSAVAS